MSGQNGNGIIKVDKLVNLERYASALREQNVQLKNNLDLKSSTLHNSLNSIFQGMQSQSQLNSMNNLAYFNNYAPLTINWTLLTYMYKTHGLLQTAIDMPVLDAMRGGVELSSNQLDADDLKAIDDRIEKSGIIRILTETGSWARLYGGGAIVINTEDDPKKPLDYSKIRKGKEMEFYAANRWEVSSPMRYSEFYTFYGKEFHRSRVLTLSGKAAPYIVKFVLQGWGMSEMERMIEDFNLYLRTKDVIYELLKEAKVDVYKFENFTQQLITAEGSSIAQRRVQIMNQIKSYMNALLMDTKDEYQQKQITFTGLAEVHKQNQVYVASALRMPCTKLFGLSASGFNSGEDDIENYNAMVESEVRQPMRPIIKEVIKLIVFQEMGNDFDIDFKYKPLRVLGEVEQETVKTSKYNRYKSQFDDGIMDAKEYAELLHSEDLIPIEPSAAKTGELFENPLKMQDDDFGGPRTKEGEDDD